MSRQPDNNKLILEQAARWHLWLRDNRADPATVDVFQRWRASSEKHRLAYERIEALCQQCEGIDLLDLPWPTELELSLDQYDGSYPLSLPERRNPLLNDTGQPETSAGLFVLGHRPPQSGQPNRHRWRAAAALGAVAVLVGLLSPLALDRLGAPEEDLAYTTAVAQQRVENLEDGSAVTLGGNSRVAVRFDKSTRRVVLERGEAYFQVAKDASRPFVVEVANSEVRAVGTAFNINRRDDAVTVSVIEGIVDVTQSRGPSVKTEPAPSRKARLKRGQELVYDRNGAVWNTRDEAPVDRAVAWRDGRLAFVNERLDRVIQDVNRYYERRVVIGDSSLAGLRYTGTVFSTDVQGWLEGLDQAFDIRSLSVDGRIILLEKTGTSG